jgi:hypothetical protein
MANDLVSELVSGFMEGVSEARAEYVRRTTPIGYWCHLFDNFSYSPQEFYALVKHHLDQRAVPDLLTQFTLMHEGTVFSKQRLYLELRRERFVFQVCAAAFGTGWFVSSRLFDKRRGATWWHFLILGFFMFWATIGLWLVFGLLVTVAVLGMALTFSWSLMRLGAGESVTRLDDLLCQLPFLGRIYETLFHPDTYFRQDQRNMYKQAVDRAVRAALGDLATQKGLQPPSDFASRPVLPEL